jgi:hypothetical protein
MATQPVLPLVASKDIEALKSWEGIQTPSDLVRLMAARLSVDPNQLNQFSEIVFSDVQPASNTTKIWIKTNAPIAIGIPSGGSYTLLYQYPPNVPFIYTDISNIPVFLRVLSQNELDTYNLTAPDAGSNASWVIMNI